MDKKVRSLLATIRAVIAADVSGGMSARATAFIGDTNAVDAEETGARQITWMAALTQAARSCGGDGSEWNEDPHPGRPANDCQREAVANQPISLEITNRADLGDAFDQAGWDADARETAAVQLEQYVDTMGLAVGFSAWLTDQNASLIEAIVSGTRSESIGDRILVNEYERDSSGGGVLGRIRVRSYLRRRPRRSAAGEAVARLAAPTLHGGERDFAARGREHDAPHDPRSNPAMQTFGAHAATPPPGALTGIVLPGIVRLNERTPDGRMIHSGGFGVRALADGHPLSFKTMFADGPGGHIGSVISGLIDEVTIDDTGLVSGRGWVLDTDEGWATGRLIQSGAMRGNSIDLSAEEYRIDFDFESGKVFIDFVKAKMAATTLVATPAMEGLYVGLEDPEFDFSRRAQADSLVASAIGEFSDGHMVSFSTAVLPAPAEATADPEPLPPASWFAALPTDRDAYPIRAEAPNEHGFTEVHGYVAAWGDPHRGLAEEGKLMTPPKSKTDYAYFANGEVLTDEGFVRTGRLVLGGDHADRTFDWRRATAAYDDTARAWADVAIGENDLGIWVHGYVRPGTDSATVAAARASGTSGDWRRIGGNLELIAVLSVNTEGFIKPGHSQYHQGGLAVSAFGLGALAPAPHEPQSAGLPASLVEDIATAAAFARSQADLAAAAEREAEAANLAGVVHDAQAAELADLAEVIG